MENVIFTLCISTAVFMIGIMRHISTERAHNRKIEYEGDYTIEKLKQRVIFLKNNSDFTVFWERLFAISLFAIFGYCFYEEILPQIPPRIATIVMLLIVAYIMFRIPDKGN